MYQNFRSWSKKKNTGQDSVQCWLSSWVAVVRLQGGYNKSRMPECWKNLALPNITHMFQFIWNERNLFLVTHHFQMKRVLDSRTHLVKMSLDSLDTVSWGPDSCARVKVCSKGLAALRSVWYSYNIYIYYWYKDIYIHIFTYHCCFHTWQLHSKLECMHGKQTK